MVSPLFSLRFCCALKFSDIQFFHLQHGLHRGRLLDQVGQAGGDDLPGKAKLVFEPATLPVAAASGKFRPIIVDLLLRVAPDDKGNRFRELEERAAVECRKRLAVEFKSDGESVRGAGCAAGIVYHFETPGVLEYRE